MISAFHYFLPILVKCLYKAGFMVKQTKTKFFKSDFLQVKLQQAMIVWQSYH